MGLGDGCGAISSMAASAAIGDVLAHVAVKEIDVLADEADGPAQIVHVAASRTSSPSSGYTAVNHVVEAQQQFDERALARAGRADEAAVAPALMSSERS